MLHKIKQNQFESAQIVHRIGLHVRYPHLTFTISDSLLQRYGKHLKTKSEPM